MTDSSGAAVVATIGDQPITLSQVEAQDPQAFSRLQSQYRRRVRQLQFGVERASQALLLQELDTLLDQRALQMEAAARGVSTESILKGIQVPPVNDEEVRAFYEQNRARSPESFERLAPQIRDYLSAQHRTDATRSRLDALRAKYSIHANVEPYRLAVAPDGPARGKSDARVTIVEFGDFQCPYCKQAEATLGQILAKHPEEVRLVFRELPLTEVHPNALVAAQAGVCADRQGKFWPMHDAMYADQSALAADQLTQTASRLGLDRTRFATCLSDQNTTQAIDADVRAAEDIGIAGTPFFFINGRPIEGSPPLETFERTISEELRRSTATLAAHPATTADPDAPAGHR